MGAGREGAVNLFPPSQHGGADSHRGDGPGPQHQVGAGDVGHHPLGEAGPHRVGHGGQGQPAVQGGEPPGQLLGGEVFFQESLSPSQIIETVKRERISVLIAVPRILDTQREKIERDYEARGKLERFQRAILDARGRHPLKRWCRFRKIHSMFGWKFWAFISGGATLAAGTEEFWDRLGFAVIQGYGMTETASLISVNHPFKLARGSIGRVMPGQEVNLAADGEILVRGENVSPGYWHGAVGAGATDDGW